MQKAGFLIKQLNNVVDLDECILSLDDCDGATCVDTDGSYRCECLLGYRPVGASLTQCEGKVDFLLY